MREPKHLIWIGALALLVAWSVLTPSTANLELAAGLDADQQPEVQVIQTP